MTHSPTIRSISWGTMEVEELGSGKDFKLWPGGGKAWDWRETDMHHEPGIQPIDVEELLQGGAEVVVLSRGMLLRLKTSPETIAYLGERGVAYHMVETTSAVSLYNDLASRGEWVGGLFHSTC